nr:hypothetical protein Iba_chr03eCG3970 [Ipomoea batatas]
MRGRRREGIYTTASLIFDFGDGTFLSPVNGVRQAAAGLGSIPPIAFRLSDSPASIGLGAESELVGPVFPAVLLVDVPEIILEDLKPLILLSAEAVVMIDMSAAADDTAARAKRERIRSLAMERIV